MVNPTKLSQPFDLSLTLCDTRQVTIQINARAPRKCRRHARNRSQLMLGGPGRNRGQGYTGRNGKGS